MGDWTDGIDWHGKIFSDYRLCIAPEDEWTQADRAGVEHNHLQVCIF